MIVALLLPGLGEGIFETILSGEFNFGIEMMDVVAILFVFSMAYIFEYGYELQLDSKGKMYGEVEDE